MRFISKIDKQFKPIYLEILESNKKYNNPFKLMIENNEGYSFAYEFMISKNYLDSYPLIERMVKSLLWIVGGNKIYLNGDERIVLKLQHDYSKNGARSFDVNFMNRIYNQPLEFIYTDFFPKVKRNFIEISKNMDGCRIGFDAGGSDWKVSAVIDGDVVFTQEVVWHPKITKDINYHYENIVTAFKLAASKMPRVDGIGVSSAGIYINNKTAEASLFLKVEQSQRDKIPNIYLDAKDALDKNIPIKVVNDGDVTAIAGSISFNSNNILGIAMGTSEAGGYVNDKGGLNGWLSELGFAPCDMGSNLPLDEWSGDFGTGMNYFSQDAVIKLAKMAGLVLNEDLSPAEKLKVVQDLMEQGDQTAYNIFESIGIYLGYTIPFYAQFYEIDRLLVLGRVTSGKGGDLIIKVANKVIKEEFPNFKIKIVTADEKFKRVGQAISAASLPIIK